MVDKITCVYCKSIDMPSCEHVLQRSLGGDLVERFVCQNCNNGFSQIDQALAERSLLSMSRVAYTPVNAFSTKLGATVTTYDQSAGIYVELELRNELRPVVLPQLHLKQNGKGTVVAPDQSAKGALITFIDDHLNFVEELPRLYGLEGKSPQSVALVVRKKDGYIRLIKAGDETWYFPMLRSAWMDDLRPQLVAASTASTTHPHPEVSVQYRYAPNDVYRAIAKSAFNLLAFKCGAPFVLRPEFDPIRQYILGDLHLPAFVESESIAVDGRFVAEVPPPEQQISFIDDEHAIVFSYRTPELVAFVTFYGSHLYIVRFPEISNAGLDDLFGHSFTTTRSGNQPLSFADIAERILNRHSDRVGLTKEEALSAVNRLRSGE